MDDETSGRATSSSHPLVARVNVRPDEPDTEVVETVRSSWSAPAVGLGVVVTILAVIALLIIIQGALDQRILSMHI